MRIGRYLGHSGAPHVGIYADDGVIDVVRHLPDAPARVIDVIGQWDLWQSRFEGVAKRTPDFALHEVKILCPIERPGKILGIGLNYADHIAEAGIDAPADQVWFAKFNTALNGPFDPITRPHISECLDYEAELVFVVGRRCRYVSPAEAEKAIFGYCAGNDVSVRDWQLKTSQFMLGKSFDETAPIGPWIVTADVIDARDLGIRSRVNGEERQCSNTRHLIFDCAQQLSHLSQVATMEPGDVIFTGTPGGVGGAFKPPRWLRPGDVVEVEVDGIGTIRNTIVADANG